MFFPLGRDFDILQITNPAINGRAVFRITFPPTAMSLHGNVNARHELLWNRHFGRLVEFHRMHGHFAIPHQGDFADLYAWLRTQCHLKQFNQLRPERQQRLEALGFDWNLHRQIDEQRWEQHFRELVAFHQVHGHFEGAQAKPETSLRAWVRTQRQLQRSGQLDAERRQRLEALGFPWFNPATADERSWNRSFDRLVEFHRIHGHFKIPAEGEYHGLYLWALKQCQKQRFNRLRPERRQRLEALGFFWDSTNRLERSLRRWQGIREPQPSSRDLSAVK